MWWEKSLEISRDFGSLLYLASISVADEEIQNYGCIAEQIWAEHEGMA